VNTTAAKNSKKKKTLRLTGKVVPHVMTVHGLKRYSSKSS